jgi:benzoyl-CoA reductase/2-hydroxyglutaryl-CoA dehydratase subunit BcrC/BadD/HgdB
LNLKDDPFLKLANTIINPYIEEWQAEGKKIVGHYCTYIPEELLYAANLLPFRIRSTGHEDTDLGDVYMVRFTCSFVRATLDMALKGMYDFLDGLVICNSCDHSRRMFELFDMKVFNRDDFKKEVPRFYLAMPHILTEEGLNWYFKEIEELKSELDQSYNKNNPISNESLIQAIKLYNKNREILRKIHELRIQNEPKLNGTEALQISMSNSSVPKDVANKELDRIYDLLKDSEGLKTESKRIMLIGSELDNLFFTKIIEDSGAIIVSDFLCFGTRYFNDDVELNNNRNPLENLTRRLYYRLSCPRMMDDHDRRRQFINREVKKANVDGIILQRINNCDLHGCDNMLFVHELKELGIPVINIDREHFQTDTTRLQTRIEAFIEMIK